MTSRLRITQDSANGLIQCSPSVSGSECSIGFYRNTGRGISATGDLWVVGHAAHTSGDRGFAIGANNLGSALSINTAGAVSIPGTLSVGGLPVSTKPYIAGRISGSTTIVGAVPIISGGTAANNAGQQLIATASRIAVGHYRVTWTTPHPNGDQFGVYLTARMANGWANWGSPVNNRFDMFCYNIVSGAAALADPTDIAFMTIP
jgi:hypothetical protein